MGPEGSRVRSRVRVLERPSEKQQRSSSVGPRRRLDLHSRAGHRDLVAAGVCIPEVAVREERSVGLWRLGCTRIQRFVALFCGWPTSAAHPQEPCAERCSMVPVEKGTQYAVMPVCTCRTEV